MANKMWRYVTFRRSDECRYAGCHGVNTEATIKITEIFVTGLVYYTWAWLRTYTKGGSELIFKYKAILKKTCRGPGNTNWRAWLSTVDLLVKVACFVKSE